MINQLKSLNIPMISKKAEDWESNINGNWINASTNTSNHLNNSAKEPQTIHFYKGALYEVTFNKDGKFSQTQVALLFDMPTQEQIDNFEPVTVMLAPEGYLSCPPQDATKEQLFEQKWRETTIPTAPERCHYINRYGVRKQVKRLQYGLRHRIASTIHASMGQDLDAIVTKISDKDPDYKLWEREQVVVLLSRTHYANQIYFVGDPDDTCDALVRLLRKSSANTSYMGYIINNLTNEEKQHQFDATEIDFQHSTLRATDAEIPCDDSGYAYILLSVRDRDTTYIGQTQNLTKRLDQHNRGIGAKQTRPEYLRPWSLLAYVTGFNGHRQAHREFETAWEQARQKLCLMRNGRTPTPDEIADLAKDVILKRKPRDLKRGIHLRFFKVATLETTGKLGYDDAGNNHT